MYSVYFHWCAKYRKYNGNIIVDVCACGCKEDFEIIRILNELKFLFVFQWNNFILYIVFYSLRFFSLIYKNFFTPPLGLSWNKRFWLYKRKCSRYFRRVSFPQKEYQILNIALTKLFFFTITASVADYFDLDPDPRIR